jgi:hypothetical protein
VTSQPLQSALDAALGAATSARVLDDGTAGGRPLGKKVLHEVDDAAELSELVATLRIVEREDEFVCMCLGGPTLEFAGPGTTVVLGLHHGSSIRWSRWSSDAPLANGRDLADWLAERGVTQVRDELDEAAERSAADVAAMARWEAALPPGMGEVWKACKRESMMTGSVDVGPFRLALDEHLPDPAERARALFRSNGSGEGPWSGFPSHETLLESLLLETDTSVLVAALGALDIDADPAVAEGAARYFAGWGFSQHRARDASLIDRRLAARLLTHVERRQDDPDRLQRARRAFRSGRRRR